MKRILVLTVLIAGCAGTASTTTRSPVSTTTTPATIPETTTRATTTTTTIPTTTTTPVTTTTTPVTTTTLQVTTTGVPSAAATVIWQAETTSRVVALTFDAGSDRGFAEGILDVLAAQSITATFGMTGKWAEANPDLLARMVSEGHALMNHTYDHPHMETLGTEERLWQLMRTEAIIADLTGAVVRPYFRPPYGAYNDRVLADVGSAGYRYSVMWTVDSLGWKGVPANQVVDRCVDGASPGAILLLHVGAASTDYQALPGIIDGLRDAGYGFATIPELIP